MNLKALAQQEECLTRQELSNYLAEELNGRSIGATYVVSTKREGSSTLIVETADGCRFKLGCETL